MESVLRGMAAIGAIFLLGACAPTMVVEQAPDSGLPGNGLYVWDQAQDRIPGDDNPRVNNDIFAATVQQAVDQALRKRGYRPGAGTEADWRLHYHASIQSQTQQVTDTRYPPMGTVMAAPVACGPYGCRGLYGWGYYGPPETVSRSVTFHEGSLIIDIHNAKTNKLVWRGSLARDVDVNQPINPVKLQQLLDRLLRQLPAAASPP